MDSKFSKPKGFGEILDHTFSLSKSRFKDFFMVFLILLGPVYLVEAIIQLLSGTSFFREVGSGSTWYEQMLASFTETGTVDSSSIGADVGLIFVGLFTVILGPVAEAAILLGINHIRKNEDFTVKSIIKEAFSRFWPMLGSTILFGLIIFGMVLVPIIIVALMGVIGAAATNPAVGILIGVVLFLAFGVVIAYFVTRWSFYFGSVVLDRKSPGFGRSWRLTRGRTWVLIGLFIVFYLIITIISFAVEATLGIALGNSVLLSIISNIVVLITTMIFSVGYGVMYLDLKVRHDADDLKELIDDYNNPPILDK
ncbi:glycerophosphoryl diester phosphodiesterase membrane domain-containing protein [Neobacillus kokaensis]|uniref:DUF7847 domain-containing protein n=1 Tax=Neobacillus kokaensis TaxID=2759023 RepID=A0ABQ3N648_9BACI|nr:glycerophosphoryl diester phosphodiesterase membrane domain-containing protein [Neobacillus kokaensis]GHH99067.1 hypothetical protein AM1BK_26100 [Neobacillus kokaensis]